MTPSIRQQAVYDTWQNTDANILVQAVAGGAKTTTLMGVLALCEFRTLFLAFNKSIQEEIGGRIEANPALKHAKSMTLHSLGLSAIKYKYGRFTLNKSKNYLIIKHLQTYNRGLFNGMSWEEKTKTTLTLMEMNDVSRLFLTEDITIITGFMSTMDKFFYIHPNMDDLWKEFLFIREQFTADLMIDYIDMIYIPVSQNLFIPIQPYYLMIDEAQDLNLVQHKMINNLIDQGDIKKWIAVGDRRQSIYGFSGSYASSFDLFKQKENVYELPLDVCYRCPTGIIDEANMIYDVIEPFKEYFGTVDTITDYKLIQDSSMVICRNSGPLLDLYFQLLSQNKKVFIKGEDILNGVIRFLRPYQYKTIREAHKKINFEILEIQELEVKTDELRFKLYKLKDNLKNFILLSKHYCKPNDKVGVIILELDSMFKSIDDSTAITLCTIHKSKGLEANIVYILNEFLIPSKFAKSPMQLEQERNLKYVARTRAKEELYYLNIKNEKDESEEI
jgi:DNA helicase-2/ATP-dependent DNA helicase PcrA